MITRFYISGMTCMGCQKTVTEKINEISGIHTVSVDLESGKAVIDADRMFTSEEISEQIGSKYTVQQEASTLEGKKPLSKIKQLTPLLLIFTYLLAGTFYLIHKFQLSNDNGMTLFMGMFFIVFSFFKFLDYKGFPDSFRRYDPLAKKVPLYAKVYPFIETLLGIAFLLEWQLRIALLATVVVLSITTIGVLRSLLQKAQIECACLGTALKLPMTEATLIENGIMLVMSFYLLVS